MTQFSFGMMFSGGGTQYVGMGKNVCDLHPAAFTTFEEASDILGIDLLQLCMSGDFSKLSLMQYAQPAIYTVGVAACRTLEGIFAIQPAVAAGHSLGEYTALTCAGAFRFDEGIRLVRLRGELLQRTGDRRKCAMMSVANLTEDQILDILSNTPAGRGIYISVCNSPHNHVLSGEIELLEKIKSKIEGTSGGEAKILHINTASHCPYMEEALEEFGEALKNVKFSKPSFEVVSNVSAEPYRGSSEIPQLLLRHLVSPLKWAQTIRYFGTTAVTHVIDCGPQAILKSLLNINKFDRPCFGLDLPDDVRSFFSLMEQPYPETEMVLRKCLSTCVTTPCKAADQREYQVRVVEKYRQLETLFKSKEWFPRHRTIAKGIEITREVLKGKGLVDDEIRQLTTVIPHYV